MPEAICCCSNNVVVQTMLLSWKRCSTHAYQISSPCVLPLTILRIEEAIFKKTVAVYEHMVVMETYSCHGRDVIRMRTKFHLEVWYRFAS